MRYQTDKTNNRYYNLNAVQFNKLLNLVCTYPYQFVRMITAKGRKRDTHSIPKYKDLHEWIYECSKLFNEQPKKFVEIIYWILNDLTDYPICENPLCNKKIKNYTSSGYYPRYCSCKCAATDIKTKQKRENTSLKKYGAKNVFASDYGKEKIMNSCLLNLGVPYSGMSDIKKKKTEETNLKKYKVKNVNQNPEIQQRGIKTRLTRYNSIFGNTIYQKYRYNNVVFDSSWELALYIYLQDNNFNFEYHSLKYIFKYYTIDGKLHTYYPDFIINGKIFEIKGEQYFNSKNEPYDIRNKCYWYEKYKCMKENGVQILRYNDLTAIFHYIENRYGKTYLSNFRIITPDISN